MFSIMAHNNRLQGWQNFEKKNNWQGEARKAEPVMRDIIENMISPDYVLHNVPPILEIFVKNENSRIFWNCFSKYMKMSENAKYVFQRRRQIMTLGGVYRRKIWKMRYWQNEVLGMVCIHMIIVVEIFSSIKHKVLVHV